MEKWDQYETGVRALLQAKDALGSKVIKLSDLIENFVGGIKHHEDISKRPRLARKYIFLSNDMVEFTDKSKIIPFESKERIITQITAAQEEAVRIIVDHIKQHPEDATLYDISSRAALRLGRTALATGYAA